MPVPQASAAQPMRDEPDAVGVDVGRRAAEQRAGRQGDVLEHEPGGRGGAQAHRRLALDADAAGARLDDEQRRRSLEVGGDDEQLGGRGPRDEGFRAVEHEAVALARGGGLQRERVEQRPRLEHGDRGRRHVVADERRQVGRLLLLVAPQHQRVAHAGRGQAGDGQAHVAVCERLGDQDAGGGRALGPHAAQALGDADQGDAELGHRALDDLRRRLARVVGRRGGRAQLLGGELAGRVDDHLLLVGRGQVEQVAPGCGARPLRLAPLARGGEAPVGDPDAAEAGLAALVHRPLDRLAQFELVDGRRRRRAG